jgi:hypothetical protein
MVSADRQDEPLPVQHAVRSVTSAVAVALLARVLASGLALTSLIGNDSAIDPLFTIEVLKRPSEAQRSSFGLVDRALGMGHLRSASFGFDRSAPQLLHTIGPRGLLSRQQ